MPGVFVKLGACAKGFIPRGGPIRLFPLDEDCFCFIR